MKHKLLGRMSCNIFQNKCNHVFQHVRRHVIADAISEWRHISEVAFPQKQSLPLASFFYFPCCNVKAD